MYIYKNVERYKYLCIYIYVHVCMYIFMSSINKKSIIERNFVLVVLKYFNST